MANADGGPQRSAVLDTFLEERVYGRKGRATKRKRAETPASAEQVPAAPARPVVAPPEPTSRQPRSPKEPKAKEPRPPEEQKPKEPKAMEPRPPRPVKEPKTREPKTREPKTREPKTREPRPSPPPREPSGDRTGRRRRIGALVVAVAAVLVLIAIALAVIIGGRSGPGTSARASGDGRAGFPAAAPRVGSYVKSTVARDGTVRTEQWTALSTSVRKLTLRPLPLAAGDNRFSPVIGKLSLTADGKRVVLHPKVVSARAVEVSLPAPARFLHITYTASGVAAKSPQAPNGRALVLVNALAVGGLPASAADIVTLTGTHVLALSCERPHRVPVACGNQRGAAWTVDTAGSNAGSRVVAQVDLG